MRADDNSNHEGQTPQKLWDAEGTPLFAWGDLIKTMSDFNAQKLWPIVGSSTGMPHNLKFAGYFSVRTKGPGNIYDHNIDLTVTDKTSTTFLEFIMSAPGLKSDLSNYIVRGPKRPVICESILKTSQDENKAPNINWQSEDYNALLDVAKHILEVERDKKSQYKTDSDGVFMW